MVTIKIFGTLRLKCGLGEFETYTHSIKDACRLLALATGTPEKEFRRCNFVVNGTKAGIGAKLSDGDELVLLATASAN